MKAKGNNKRIAGLYVVNNLYPHITGGMEIFNYYFLKHQFAAKPDSTYYVSKYPLENFTKGFVSLKGIKPIRFFYPIQFLLSVLKLRKVIGFAAISFSEQSWILSFSQALILRFFKIPYMVTIHWGKEPVWKFEYPFRYFFKYAHTVVGVSRPVCKAYSEKLVTKDVIFLPPLIPFTSYAGTKQEAKRALGYTGDEYVILFVGTLKGMKNPDVILQSLKLLPVAVRESYKIRMLFAGGGEMLEELKSTVKKESMDGFVKLSGSVNREDVPCYYKAADCYIISSDYEGTSISLLEAMFNKLPIVASNAPGINEMLVDSQSAVLYETKSPEQLAQSFVRIVGDKGLAARLSSNAYKTYEERYSFDSMMNEYELIFASMIK